MKRISLTYLFFIHTLLCISQNLVQEGKLWSNVVIGTEQGSQPYTYFIKFQGDTLIGTIDYRKVWKANDKYHENWLVSGYIREDSLQKVFLYNTELQNDELIYDFGLEIGDSILAQGINLPVDTIIYNIFGNSTDTLKQIFFNDGTIWVEGIGSNRGVLEGINRFFLVGEDVDLICYFESNNLIYHNPNFGECYVTSVSEALIINNMIEVTQQQNDWVIIKNHTNKKGIFQVYDIIGNQIIQENIESNEIQICLPVNGAYIYRFISKKGEVQNGKFVVW